MHMDENTWLTVLHWFYSIWTLLGLVTSLALSIIMIISVRVWYSNVALQERPLWRRMAGVLGCGFVIAFHWVLLAWLFMFITTSVEGAISAHTARLLSPYSLTVGGSELIFGYLFIVRRREPALARQFWQKVYPVVMGIMSLTYCLTFLLAMRLAPLGSAIAIPVLYFVWRKSLYTSKMGASRGEIGEKG